MVQEGAFVQPIDYRDIVIPYTDANTIPYYVENIVRETADTIQSIDATYVTLPTGLLERIDLGDIAAENEIKALSKYFVKTPQFQQARQGHARLVIGRKGAGKTALFYGIRNQFPQRGDTIVLDLKPEGHQFTRLREMVLSKLSEGLQLHTLTAFWHYLLLLELTKKLISREQYDAAESPEKLAKFNELVELYEAQPEAHGDFSERLMALVDRIVERFPVGESDSILTRMITEAIYKTDISDLTSVLLETLSSYDGVWILIDNIDKGFPTHGLQQEDVFTIRCLLEATRKLQVSLESRRIECNTVVFIRKDVFDLLVDLTPDRGKETYVNLDWSDIELIKELLLRRFRYQVPELLGAFEEVWNRLFDPLVGGESSFGYILSRTFFRPRDILNFVRKCIQIAVSRGHNRVLQEDIIAGEVQFSLDMLNDLRYEVRDIFPQFPDFAPAFLGAVEFMTSDDVALRLMDVGVPEKQVDEVKNVLLWFSFLGVRIKDNESYAYEVAYDIAKLEAQHEKSTETKSTYSIHPAFRAALSLSSNSAA
jgi:ABC-type cobalamin/Fe3+-siderophores transport system ATPase subunit